MRCERRRIPSSVFGTDAGTDVRRHGQPEAHRNAGVSLTCNVPADVERYVDRRAFREVLFNPLANACRFTHHGAPVSVDMEEGRDGNLRIVATDNGRGIPARRLSGVVDPFVQANRNRLVAESGIGLELAIVKVILDSLGTAVSVMLPPELHQRTRPGGLH